MENKGSWAWCDGLDVCIALLILQVCSLSGSTSKVEPVIFNVKKATLFMFLLILFLRETIYMIVHFIK